MAISGMKVVARPIKVRRHCGNEVTTVLLAIGLTEHDATDLRNRIPLICRFERAGQERLFAHRLRRFSRVDAGGAQKKKLLDPKTEGSLNDVELERPVVVQEAGGRTGVCMNAPDLRRSQNFSL